MIDFKKLQAAATAISEAGENVIYPDERSLTLEEEEVVAETPPPALAPKTTAAPVSSASQKPDWLADLEAASEKRKANATAGASKASVQEDEPLVAEPPPRLPLAASNDEMAMEEPRVPIMTRFSPESHPAANDHAGQQFLPNHAAAKSALKMFQRNLGNAEGEPQTYTAKKLFRNITFTAIPPAILKTATDDSLAAEGMVAHASAQGWSPIRIEGTDIFKAHAFLHAVRMGVEVAGYTPTAVDLDAIGRAGLPMPEWVHGNQICPAGVQSAPTHTGRKAPRQPALGM